MSVTFKKIKYKHLIEAGSLGMYQDTQIKLGDPASSRIIEFAVSLVKEWDYIDDDTGGAVPVGEYLELTVEQFNDLMAQFNTQMMGLQNGVKKTKVSPSSYGLTPSKAKRNHSQIPQTG